MSSDLPRHDEGYFNDLSRQPSMPQVGMNSPPDQTGNTTNGEDGGAPTLKRVACVICRKRKLKCDGGRPKCGTCSRLGHNCAYDEVRRKSGPKRGYVKELEARLAQVETRLKTKDRNVAISTGPKAEYNGARQTPVQNLAFERTNSTDSTLLDMGNQELMKGLFDSPFVINHNNTSPVPSLVPDTLSQNQSLGLDDTVSWEMVGLGLEEPLPTQEAVDELQELYFSKIHPCIPMVHKYRFMAAMNLAPHMRPPVCLRYAMWCLAAGVSDRYYNHQEMFYRRARKYAELDDMKGQGQAGITIAHVQCWAIISTYEFRMMYFPRAWTNAGRAVRLAQMMGLHRLDEDGMDVKECLPPPRDWTDREQRRRAFWMTYCMDRYASIGTGWPMLVDERDILTNLPASEEAYDKSIPQETIPLRALTSQGAASLSSFAGVVFMAHFMGRNLTHLHRPETNDREHDIQGEFWKRHRTLDNALLNTALSLPPHLRLPAGIRDANTVFLNMNLHTSTICLHQAAIFKAEQNNLPASIIEQSGDRCILAASEITTIMRLTSHLDVAGMNPFLAFCLYVAARVFIRFLKKGPSNEQILASLQFLLDAMNALKKANPLTESFLIQLSLDVQGNGLAITLHGENFSAQQKAGMCTAPVDSRDVDCSPLFEVQPSVHKEKLYPYGNDLKTGGRRSEYTPMNFKLPTRETPKPSTNLPQSPDWSTQFQGIVPPHGLFTLQPNGVIENNKTINAFDTEMSDVASSNPNPTGLTPSTSHHSSNTSYSPPQDEDLNPNYLPTHRAISGATTYAPSMAFLPRQNDDAKPSAEEPQTVPDDGSFTIPPGWHLESTGDTPSAIAGSNTFGEVGWGHMLEGMGWDNQFRD